MTVSEKERALCQVKLSTPSLLRQMEKRQSLTQDEGEGAGKAPWEL